MRLRFLEDQIYRSTAALTELPIYD